MLNESGKDHHRSCHSWCAYVWNIYSAIFRYQIDRSFVVRHGFSTISLRSEHLIGHDSFEGAATGMRENDTVHTAAEGKNCMLSRGLMSSGEPSKQKTVLKRRPSSGPQWIGRGLVSLALAWTFAHFVTLGSPLWGPGTRHDAVIFGQMIAVGVFPILFLIAFGMKIFLRGTIVVGIACLIAASGLMINR
ncbi:hypothetical protein [Gluconobacter japonicus]|uniref:hypothetical protein n=1 Tax=Gluconobacter japonicus TaxID=376620 RepID=UPI000A816219|nr:hypothetical protein [Gluconobacter japonicus]